MVIIKKNIAKVIRVGKKYKNQIISYNGMKFDSKLEFSCYKSIKKFTDKKNLLLFLQKPFIINAIGRKYIADFVVTCPITHKFMVLDAKGVETAIFKIKKKLLGIQGIVVNCVKTPTASIALLKKYFE